MKMKRLFFQLAAAAGAGVLLAGCGLLEQYEDLKTEVKQEAKEPHKATRPKVKARPKEQTESEVVIERETELPTEQKESEDPSDIHVLDPDNYAYLTLEEEERRVYNEMLDAIIKHEESIEVSTLDIDLMERAYKAISADYGGLFWVSGYVYTQYTRNGEPEGMEFAPKYTMSYDEREQIQKQIDASVEELLAGISITDSDYEKAKYVFEILVQNVDYDTNANNNQNIISAFLNRATVCQGYACATQYLMRILGIQSAIVTGNANGESHAWNLVCLDGEYYYMDTTWGNSRYLDNDSQMEKYVNYNYLAITSEEIGRTHILDNSFLLPECTGMKNNYFVKENRYFSEWNPDAIGAVLAETWKKGGGDVAVKFSSPELYSQALEYFIASQHIADYCTEISSINYLEDKALLVLTFHF